MKSTQFEIFLYIATMLALCAMVAYVFYQAGKEKGKIEEANRQLFFTPSEVREMAVDLSKTDEELEREYDEKIKRLADLRSFEQQI